MEESMETGDESNDIGPEYAGPHLSWPLNLRAVLKMLEAFKAGQVLHHK